MPASIAFLLLFSQGCLSQAALWAVAKYYPDSDNPCGGDQVADGDTSFPLLLDTCSVAYRPGSNTSNWLWVKNTCSPFYVTRKFYKDNACTVEADKVEESWPVACTQPLPGTGEKYRSIDCDAKHDVVSTHAYGLPPGMDASSCNTRYQNGDAVLPIEVCYTKNQAHEPYTLVGVKAMCCGEELIVNTYADALKCGGQATKSIAVGTSSCTKFGVHPSSWLKLQNSCGVSSSVECPAGASSSPPQAKLSSQMFLLFFMFELYAWAALSCGEVPF